MTPPRALRAAALALLPLLILVALPAVAQDAAGSCMAGEALCALPQVRELLAIDDAAQGSEGQTSLLQSQSRLVGSKRPALITSEGGAPLAADSPVPAPLSFDKLQSFVIFIGTGRSASSMVGSILDAHPHMVIANQFNLFTDAVWPHYRAKSAEHLFSALAKLSAKQGESQRTGGGGYTYSIEGQWQGKVQGRAPFVIGDKDAGGTASRGIKELTAQLRTLANMTKLPMKLVHMSRNPFDNIATKYVKLRSRDLSPKFHSNVEQEYFASVKEYGGAPWQVEVHGAMDDFEDKTYFPQTSTTEHLQLLLKKDPYAFGVLSEMITFDMEEFVHAPRTHIENLCGFLEIECSEDYLQATSALVRPDYHYSRLDLDWGQQHICKVAKRCLSSPLLAGYMTAEPTPANLANNSATQCRGQCFPGDSPCPCAADYLSTCQS